MTDWSECIVAIARLRDRQRFVELFEHFAPRCKSFFIRLGVSPGVAEELAQETLLAVWHKADSFDPGLATASTWIFTIARNLRIDLQRRERDPARLSDFFAGMPQSSPSDCVLSAERDRRIHAALAELPEEQAAVIRLSFFEDRPHGEIARLLGIPLGTVKSRVRLAVNRLRAFVEDRQ
ncbi:MAG TPA: sigma-70 family RNA polymerase sigma factor [Rhizomicrobium sp.]